MKSSTTPGFSLVDQMESILMRGAPGDVDAVEGPQWLERLVEFRAAASPSPAFVDALASRLATAEDAVPKTVIRRRRWARVAAALTVGAGLVVGAMLLLRPSSPSEVSAAEILQRAQETAAVASQDKVQSFSFTVRHTLLATVEGVERPIHETQLRRWVEQPDRWRMELWFFDFDDGGARIDEGKRAQLFVSDGTTVTWVVDGETTTEPFRGPDRANTSLTMGTVEWTDGATTLEEALAEAEMCFEPRLAGTGEMLGRTVYIVDLGQDRCHQPRPEALTARPARIWVDAETFLTLRWESPPGSAPNVRMVSEVIDLDLAPQFSPETFSVPR